MFVSWKVISGKPLFKLSCVYLLLEKVVNGKHFPVKEKFNLVFRKVFSFGCVCFPESGFWKTTFQTFMCLFAIRKVGQRKTLITIIIILIWSIFFWFFIVFLGLFIKKFIVFNYILQIKFIVFIFSITIIIVIEIIII
jgi:hypothetical protein